MPTLRDAAAEAFAAGWVLSFAPLASDYKPRALAAIELACERPDDPAILEATLQLGHLEGIWKTVYDRRDRLVATHLKRITAAWNAIVSGLDIGQLVTRFRSAAYLTDDAAESELDALTAHLAEGRPIGAWQPRHIPGAVMAAISEDLTKNLTITESVNPHRQFWRDTAITAALAWLRQVYTADGYNELVTAVEDAIRAGMAEGEAGALALAASKQGKTGFDIAAAFKAAYAKAGKGFRIPSQAQDVVTRIIDGAGGDAGRKLASLAGNGASKADMADAASDVVSGPDVPSVTTWTDWGIWAAMGAGALDLYASADAQTVQWITAGDANVCESCQDNEDNSPYPVGEVPSYPDHPRCRCYLDSDDPGLSAQLMAYYFG